MYTGNLFPAVGERKGKGKLGDPLGLGARDDLEGLDDPSDGLMLQSGVFSLGVLANDAKVDVFMAGLVAGYILEEDDGCVNVEFLS